MKVVLDSIKEQGVFQTLRGWNPAKHGILMEEIEKRGPLRNFELLETPDFMFYSDINQAGPFFLGPIGEEWLRFNIGHNSWSGENYINWIWLSYNMRECDFEGNRNPNEDDECHCFEDDNGDWIECSNCEYGSDYCHAHRTYH